MPSYASGKRESPLAYTIRDFLRRSDVPFDWVELIARADELLLPDVVLSSYRRQKSPHDI